MTRAELHRIVREAQALTEREIDQSELLRDEDREMLKLYMRDKFRGLELRSAPLLRRGKRMIGTYSDEAIAEAQADRQDRKRAATAKKLRKIQADQERVYAIRIEADRFAFAVTFFDGKAFKHWWGKQCLTQARDYLCQIDPGLIFFHRGEESGFSLVFDWFEGRIVLNEDRILGGEMFYTHGTHRLVDTVTLFDAELEHYRALRDRPAPPAIDDDQRRNHDRHRAAILKRMFWECGAIWQTISDFRNEYGSHLTVGAAAIAELNDRHFYMHLDKAEDREIRNQFYWGGRNERFVQLGVHRGSFKLFDVNSMYAHVMRSYLHPIGIQLQVTNTITPASVFIIARGRSLGHLAWTDRQERTHYTAHDGEFCMTIHEWKAAHKLGMWDGEPELLHVFEYPDQSTFGAFVDDFYSRRLAAIDRGDQLRAEFANNILRAASGKFAQNPNKYFEHRIQAIGAPALTMPGIVRECWNCQHECCFDHWQIVKTIEAFGKEIWRRNRSSDYTLNVATAASITGAARAILMIALAGATNPMYCDTDSIICEAIKARQHPRELGAWKCEAAAHTLALAGMKHYALFGDQCLTCGGSQESGEQCDDSLFHDHAGPFGGGCVKLASAGSLATPGEIVALAQGEMDHSELKPQQHSMATIDRIQRRYTLDAAGELAIETGLRGDR